MSVVKFTKILLMGLLLFHGSLVYGDYRVFSLVIENLKNNSNKQFLSTLDPEQYQTFYPLKPFEKISYQQTWLCLGSGAGYKSLCPPPQKISKIDKTRP